MSEVVEIRPREFMDRWPTVAERDGVILLDVREPAELEQATVGFAKHMPMGQVPVRLEELDARATIVVMCHRGSRSRQVAHYLAARGFPTVLNLAGGIDAWTVEVDGTVPRY